MLWACCPIYVPPEPTASAMVCKRRWTRAACQQTQPRESHGPFSREVVKTTKETSPSAQLLHIKANVCIFSGYTNLLYLRFVSDWVLGAEIQPRAPLTLQSCRSLQAALFPPHSTAAPGGGGDPKLDPSSISHFSVLETTSTSRDAQIDTQAPWRWNSPGGSHCAPLSLQVGDAGGGGVGRVQGGGLGTDHCVYWDA